MAKGSKITIIGASGFVGSTLTPLMDNFVIAPDPPELDITKKPSIEKFLGENPTEVIINLAAYTDVNQAEAQRDDKSGAAWKINVEGVENLSEICKKLNIFLITIGTDFEFSGLEDNKGPYKESEPPHNKEDLSWYGYTKAKGAAFNQNGAHVRISYPYGNQTSEKDFVRKIQSFIQKGYKLVTDQWITPTYIPDLAKALQIIAKKRLKGTFHVASPKSTNFYEFGKCVAPNQEVLSAKMSEIDAGGAKRPQYGGLDVKKSQEVLKLKFQSYLLAQRN